MQHEGFEIATRWIVATTTGNCPQRSRHLEVESGFRLGEPADWFVTKCGREKVITRLEARKRLKDTDDALCERHAVRRVGFESLGRDCPNEMAQVEFIPSGIPDFSPSLSSKSEQAKQWSEGITKATACPPVSAKLIVIEHSLTWLLGPY